MGDPRGTASRGDPSYSFDLHYLGECVRGGFKTFVTVVSRSSREHRGVVEREPVLVKRFSQHLSVRSPPL